MELDQPYLTEKSAYEVQPAKYNLLELKTTVILSVVFDAITDLEIQTQMLYLMDYKAGEEFYDLVVNLGKATRECNFKRAVELIEGFVEKVDEADFARLIKKSYLNRLTLEDAAFTLVLTLFLLVNDFYGNGNLYGLLDGGFKRVSVLGDVAVSFFDFMLQSLASIPVGWLSSVSGVKLPTQETILKWYSSRGVDSKYPLLLVELQAAHGVDSTVRLALNLIAIVAIQPLFYRSKVTLPVLELVKNTNNLLLVMKSNDGRHKKILLGLLLYRSIVPPDLLWFRGLAFSEVGVHFDFKKAIHGWSSFAVSEHLSEDGSENFVLIEAVDEKTQLEHTMVVPHNSFSTPVASLLYANEIYLLNLLVSVMGLGEKVRQAVSDLTEEELSEIVQSKDSYKTIFKQPVVELKQQLLEFVDNRILSLRDRVKANSLTSSVLTTVTTSVVLPLEDNFWCTREEKREDSTKNPEIEREAANYFCVDLGCDALHTDLYLRYLLMQQDRSSEEENSEEEMNTF